MGCDLRKMFPGCQWMANVPNAVEINIADNFNRLTRAHERYRQTDYRQTTDGRAIAYSEREREFTFAKNATVADDSLYSSAL